MQYSDLDAWAVGYTRQPRCLNFPNHGSQDIPTVGEDNCVLDVPLLPNGHDLNTSRGRHHDHVLIPLQLVSFILKCCGFVLGYLSELHWVPRLLHPMQFHEFLEVFHRLTISSARSAVLLFAVDIQDKTLTSVPELTHILCNKMSNSMFCFRGHRSFSSELTNPKGPYSAHSFLHY